jgi:iron-sulfur cluster assembly protein
LTVKTFPKGSGKNMDLVEKELITLPVTASALTLTPTAAATIGTLLEQRRIPGYVLRVFVQGGGCSGLQYGMAFEAQPEEHDTVVETDGVRLVVDANSMNYLHGATIDFVDSLMGGGFRIDNPNAVSSCGCGHSFKSSSGGNDTSGGGCSSCSH